LTVAEDPVVIVPYDPAWPGRFEAERVLLEATLQPWLAGPIEPIGSTAIPGMEAKPVIDIMAPVESLAASRPAIEALRSLQYHYAPYKTDVMHWLCKPGPVRRTHHLHLVPMGSETWHARLAFRDCVRADAGLAEEYAALKRRLAALFRDDREAYTEGKRDFVARVLQGRATPG
jgi:GrpB-like predicted nucleotidyltransferase (UPF0157 family)